MAAVGGEYIPDIARSTTLTGDYYNLHLLDTMPQNRPNTSTQGGGGDSAPSCRILHVVVVDC